MPRRCCGSWRATRGDDPTNLESALTGKPVPAFARNRWRRRVRYYPAERCADAGKTGAANVWAARCPTCRALEHQVHVGFCAGVSGWSG
ncbi:hypothetical protein KCP75_11575 [Salmonella enterica subsp. enterica]|nr:hypothetical protein KCP75_11575 [Salmonella enterica subsp. enterica]